MLSKILKHILTLLSFQKHFSSRCIFSRIRNELFSWSDWIIVNLFWKHFKNDSDVSSEIWKYNKFMEKYIARIYSWINALWNKVHKLCGINGKIDAILSERYSWGKKQAFMQVEFCSSIIYRTLYNGGIYCVRQEKQNTNPVLKGWCKNSKRHMAVCLR